MHTTRAKEQVLAWTCTVCWAARGDTSRVNTRLGLNDTLLPGPATNAMIPWQPSLPASPLSATPLTPPSTFHSTPVTHPSLSLHSSFIPSHPYTLTSILHSPPRTPTYILVLQHPSPNNPSPPASHTPHSHPCHIPNIPLSLHSPRPTLNVIRFPCNHTPQHNYPYPFYTIHFSFLPLPILPLLPTPLPTQAHHLPIRLSTVLFPNDTDNHGSIPLGP